jgi:alkanesulfonate monooxygenase SsuD/methylene tetrahydromethanopterin reductase-like flavin-dependent oxidoreductase (luciferase family)/putative sterol carrier protein
MFRGLLRGALTVTMTVNAPRTVTNRARPPRLRSATMRFSIFYEHQLPRPWDAESEHRLLKEALEQVELADRLGYDAVWEVEHHFLEEYSHSSASDVFLAACAARTKNIRLGLGIVPLPPAYQHPARVAETVATLDLVSDGRVELGTGETSSGAELAGFGVDRKTKRAQWDEALGVAARMMVEAPFAGHEGRFVSMPPRNVIPKPLQKPHPPLWVACSRRETIRLAAEKGLGALSFSFVEPEEAKAWVDEYYDIVTSDRCVPAGFSVNPNVAVTLPMMVHADEAEAIERGIDGAHFFGYALAHYYVFGEHVPGRTSIWDEFLERRDEVGFARSIITAGDAPLGMKVLQQGLGSLRGAIGTPAQVADLARRYEEAGVDELIFVLQAGRTKHQHILEALELFAAEVMPEFRARRAEREAAKARRLGDAPERALARRPPPQEVDPAYRFAPRDTGGAASAPAFAANGDGRRPGALRRLLEERGEKAFQAFVKRADDRRLERAAGSPGALRVLFGAMERQFVPERAAGFTGEIQYDLRTRDGRVRSWTVAITPEAATARPGAAAAPKLTVKLGLADFLRLAGRDLDPGKALLTGRMDLEGDFAVAARLGEMFGQPSAF